MAEFHLALAIFQHLNEHLDLAANFRLVVRAKFAQLHCAFTLVADIHDQFL